MNWCFYGLNFKKKCPASHKTNLSNLIVVPEDGFEICLMKKFFSVFIIVVLTGITLHAQTIPQIKNLATLAKVWGFLKYYHPEAAKGNPDWDKELIKMIPIVKSSASKTAFSKLLIDWYNSLPKAKLSDEVTQPKAGDSIEKVFDETYIARFDVPPSLISQLTRLYLYHLPDTSKYITNRSQQYTLDYTKHTEDPFAMPALPDEAHRLLAFFRYWNIIEYFYPHKKTNAPGWDKVLPEFIPRFMAANDSTKYRQTFLILTTKLKDSHSFFYHPVWDRLHNYMYPPFRVIYIDGRYFISGSRYDSLMKAMDLKRGDEIVGVNGKPIAERINELKPYTTGTNELSFYRNICQKLLQIDTTRTVQVTINREGRELNRTVSLVARNEFPNYHSSDRPLWKDMGNGIWYVRFCDIRKMDTLEKLFADIQQAKTVIWDLRAYPDFFISQAAKKGLFAQNPLCHITYNSILEFPGAFGIHTWPVLDEKAPDTLHLPVYQGRMIVLVDEYTQSLSESCAYELSFREHTIVMGRQTAGTTGNVNWIDSPGGIGLSYTAVGMKALKERFTEGAGVKIDKEIKLSAGNLLEYPDYILELAYREAQKELW
jgi:hypothetical protein